MVGKLFQDSRRQIDLCFWNGGAEKCYERRQHGCGGDGDDDNCQTRLYVKVERLEAAKQNLLSRLAAANGRLDWSLTKAIVYTPAEVAEFLGEER